MRSQHEKYNCYLLADDVGGLGPRTERLLELAVSVVVRSEVRVRIDVHVVIVSPGRSHCLLVETEWSRSVCSPSQLFHVTNTTHRYWIPASAAALITIWLDLITAFITEHYRSCTRCDEKLGHWLLRHFQNITTCLVYITVHSVTMNSLSMWSCQLQLQPTYDITFISKHIPANICLIYTTTDTRRASTG